MREDVIAEEKIGVSQVDSLAAKGVDGADRFTEPAAFESGELKRVIVHGGEGYQRNDY